MTDSCTGQLPAAGQTGRLHLSSRHREKLDALLREHLPGIEVWAYGSRVNGNSHDGSDLDLVLRAPDLQEIPIGPLTDFTEALHNSTLPFLVEARDWARLPESFHREIEQGHVVLTERKNLKERTTETLLLPSERQRLPASTREKEGGNQDLQCGWRTASLGDVIELKRGYDLPQRQRVPGTVPIVSSSGVTDHHSKSKVQGPGVVTGRYGTLGKVFFIPSDFWPLNTTLYVRDFKGNDPRFISYFLRELDFSAYSDKAAVPGLNRNHLHQETVRIPTDVNEQRAIAHILGTLDDKIELNRRMNETLEAMARALFKSWFVDFDPVRAKMEGRWHPGESLPGLPAHLYDLFPDRLVESELGEIPEGWRVGYFDDIVDHIRDKENPLIFPDTVFHHFSIPAFDKNRWPQTERGENIKSQKSRVPPGVILLSKLNPEIERVWFVDVASGERTICSTEFLVLQARSPFQRSYVYCLARSPRFRQQIESLVTGTSKSHQRAHAIAILALETIIPSARTIRAFDQQASDLLVRSVDYRRDNISLASLRDALLPKLISGKIRICHSEIQQLFSCT